MSRYLDEFMGTFVLVFAGRGASIVNDVSGAAIGHVGIALTSGLIVITMVYAAGVLSGAHLNPAVSAGFWFGRRLPLREVGLYTLSQLAGALAAMFARPISGASMNPARSVAPALVSGNLGQVWIYLVAPFIGASLVILSCRLMRTADCCAVLERDGRWTKERWEHVSANP